MKCTTALLLLLSFHLIAFTQKQSTLNADQWVDSVFNSLSKDEKIAQLFIVRTSAPPPQGSSIATFYDKEVMDAIRKYNIGGICLFPQRPVHGHDVGIHYKIHALPRVQSAEEKRTAFRFLKQRNRLLWEGQPRKPHKSIDCKKSVQAPPGKFRCLCRSVKAV